MHYIYFDNNATSPLDSKVDEFLREFQRNLFGNASSIHWAGREAKKQLNIAREKISSLFNASESEIIFTSGGTESINTALLGVFESGSIGKNEIITTPVEHHATLRTLQFLESKGKKSIYLKVDSKGRIDLEDFQSKINSNTALVSMMWANNEIGNLNPIEKISEICREKNILFHCDAVQAVGKIRIDLKKVPIDLLSFSAHKFHGPKGVGGLYLREGVKISPLHFGGSQEKSLRAGTQDVLRIHGMAIALEESLKNLEENSARICYLRNQLEEGILSRIEGSSVQGDSENRLFNTSNILFENIDGETLLLNLDLEGIAVSAGAACESGSIDPSHVILALGKSSQEAKSSIRFSLSKLNTEEEVQRVIEVLPKIIQRLQNKFL